MLTLAAFFQIWIPPIATGTVAEIPWAIDLRDALVVLAKTCIG